MALVGLLIGTLTATAAAEQLVEQTVAGRGAFPSLAAVQRAAEEVLGVATLAEVEDWRDRARWRGVLPVLELGLGSDADLDIRDSWSGTPVRITTEGRALGLRASMKWELGEVVFGDLELRANREALARAAAVALAKERVTRLYFERLELELRIRAGPTVELRFEAAQLDGLLEAATGGRWRRKDGTK